MYFRILLNYILGYINIEIEGFFIERFINTCISKNILLWNMKREKSSILHANVGIKDFKRIKHICKSTKCKAKISKKAGLPFLFNRYRKRKIFFILLALILIIIIFSTNFVWNIDIISDGEISREEIMSVLNDNGLTLGKPKNKLNTKNIIDSIRLQRSDIAWIGIKLDGTNAIVEVVSSSKKPDIINQEDYCNIVSDKEGIITKISAQNGTALVKEGDLVRNGTILIGGWLEGKFTGTRYVHAIGDIEAKVWYSKREKIYLNQEVQEQTGNQEKKYSIRINNFQINLYKKLSKFEIYDTISTSKKLKLFSNFYLPFELTTKVNNELEIKQIEYTLEEAKQMGVNSISKELEELIQDSQNIVNKQINYYENEGYVEVEVIYEVLEKIGTKEKIIF